jgi:hypothetical protein
MKQATRFSPEDAGDVFFRKRLYISQNYTAYYPGIIIIITPWP